MSNQILQHILFPNSEELSDNWELFYQGTHGIVKDGALCLPAYTSSTFCTYLNGFSNAKWKQYTNVNDIKLAIDITGECEIKFVGYSMPMYTPVKKVFGKQIHDNSTSRVEFTFPQSEESILGFEICCYTDCVIKTGYYFTEIDDAILNNIDLSIATTTCFKENFIKNNIQSIYDNLLVGCGNIANHLWVHIVDNGRTLSRDDFPQCDHIFFHPNKNVGGSGGFARGMIESLEQEAQITNVLLMDDDVLVLPESIYKTYMLLRFMKEEYQNTIINGAMLYLENKNCQHEDIGFVNEKALMGSVKPKFDFRYLNAVLDNEKYYSPRDNQYGAWWFNCIPANLIKENGLPLPLFIRIDDMEYGNRCKTDFITMNGISVWHMGFLAKFNASFDLYQEERNKLIAKSTTGVLKDIDVFKGFIRRFRVAILTFNYSAAELLNRALSDYLKGPNFIKEDLGEQIMKENAKKNEQLKPVSTITTEFVDCEAAFVDCSRGKLQRLLYGITYNGQRFVPEILLKTKFIEIPFNTAYTPGKIFWRKKLLAVNPDNRTGIMRTMDKKRFKNILKEYKKLMKQYKRTHVQVEQAYRDAREELTSIEFWKKYLEI